jgi:hypothetical protein
VRRVVALAPAGAREAVQSLLDSLSGVSAVLADSLDTVPWLETDVLWLHDIRPIPSDNLIAWLRAGGRLLATLDAAAIAVDLGLESVAPDDVRDATWAALPDVEPRVGLAGFGPHPLYTGLQQGACTWAPVEGEPYHWVGYLSGRPASGGVVGVARRGMALDPARVIAWEYAVGEGGLLCLGAAIYPDAPDPSCLPQLRTLLGNALAGQGIPHGDRPAAARHWPAPGRTVWRTDLAPASAVTGLDGEWPAAPSALALDFPVESDDPWTLAGRRGFLAGGERTGLREVWLHPYRVLANVVLSVAGATPIAARMRVTPDQVDRHSDVGGVPVLERWTIGLEYPALYWQVEPGEGRALLLEWTSDLRRTWPYRGGCAGDLELSVAPGGRQASLGAAGDPFRLVIDIEGGTLEAAPLEGPAVRFSVRSVGACRLRFVGAADEADRDRTRQFLERRGFAGIRAQRAEHARELAAYATSIACPEPALVEAFEWAKVRMDGALLSTPGIGRSLAAAYAASTPGAGDGMPGAAWYFGGESCWTAMAQLAAGDRGAPRDALKFLSLTQDVDGRILGECTASGLARYGGDTGTPLYLLLTARYAAWTGELDFIARRWSAVQRALATVGSPTDLAEEVCWVAALEELQPLAEALGHPETAEELAGLAASGRRACRSALLASDSYGSAPSRAPDAARDAVLLIPILLGLVEPAEARAWLADRDARLEGARPEPPLVASILSQAEFRAGRFESGLAHWRSAAAELRRGSKGAFSPGFRVPDACPGEGCPDHARTAAMVAGATVEGLWGVRPNALESAVRLAPWFPPEWEQMELERLRVGRTVLGVRLRRRFGQVAALIERIHGPRMHVEFELQGAPPAESVMLDDVALPPGRVAFEADGRHALVWHA